MDTNLMGPTGMKNRFDQCRRTQTFEKVVRSSRGSAHVFVHGHAFAVGGMASNGRPNLPSFSLHLAADNSVIRLIHASTCELVGERQVRVIVFCDDEATARVFVEAMHNSW